MHSPSRPGKRLLGLAAGLATIAAAVFVAAQTGDHKISHPADVRLKASLTEYPWRNASGTPDHPMLLPAVNDYLSGLPKGASVLDLGCGNGAFLSNFRGRGWRLAGVDTSTSGIEIARHQWPDIHFEVADATGDLSSLGYGTFDAVISTDVVEHIFLPRLFAANCFRLLKPDGVLVISTPYHGYAKNVAIALSHGWDLHVDPLWDYGHIKFWSVHTLSELLFESGFEDLEWRGVGRVPLLWKDMVFKARTPAR